MVASIRNHIIVQYTAPHSRRHTYINKPITIVNHFCQTSVTWLVVASRAAGSCITHQPHQHIARSTRTCALPRGRHQHLEGGRSARATTAARLLQKGRAVFAKAQSRALERCNLRSHLRANFCLRLTAVSIMKASIHSICAEYAHPTWFSTVSIAIRAAVQEMSAANRER